MTTTAKPTLTDKAGMGGIIAEDGFDYQRFAAFTRVPHWLTNPAFESLIFEGFEDFEARFFAFHADDAHVLERYQAKSADLGPADVKEVFEKFQAYESAYPRRTRLHSLVTPRMPATLSWMVRDPERVRRARPFYAPFGDVVAENDAAVEKSFTDTYPGGLGAFVAMAVEVKEQNLPDRTAAVSAFGQALLAAFPSHDVGHRAIAEAFKALEALANDHVGKPIQRAAIVAALEPHLGFTLPTHAPFPLRVRSDRNGSDESAIEIDATAFSMISETTSPAMWTNGLIKPATRAADDLHKRGVTRIALSGSFRLTTGFVLGHSFRSARGFELDIATKAGPWKTDDHPDGSVASRWQFALPKRLHGDELVVAVGVVNNPVADVRAFTKATEEEMFTAFFAEGISSSLMAQSLVAEVKRAIGASASALRPKRIKLFMLGPAAFAVALGHRWNAMGETLLHEFNPSTRSYVLTATVA